MENERTIAIVLGLVQFAFMGAVFATSLFSSSWDRLLLIGETLIMVAAAIFISPWVLVLLGFWLCVCAYYTWGSLKYRDGDTEDFRAEVQKAKAELRNRPAARRKQKEQKPEQKEGGLP